VMDADGLGDLQEPDQLQPVQTLGARLVAVDLRQPRVDGRVRANEASAPPRGGGAVPVVGGCGSPPEPALEGLHGQCGCRDRAACGELYDRREGSLRHAVKFNVARAGLRCLAAPTQRPLMAERSTSDGH
jgi:hypothetical protein